MITPYPYVSRNELSFEFETNQGIVYSAYFFDYDFLFTDFPEFSKDIYSFNLDVIRGSADYHIADERIGVTIVAIFQHFF